jgi:hypothetical protein
MGTENKSIKIAAFGCWNTGCVENDGQFNVSKLIKKNEKEYNFMIILGDNYYNTIKNDKDEDKKKKKEKEKEKEKEKDKEKDKDKDKEKEKEKVRNPRTIEQGFMCLKDINLQKKLIMGNHDINDDINNNCKNLLYQCNELNSTAMTPLGFTYEIKFPYAYDLLGTLLILYIDTTIYSYKNVDNTDNCYCMVLNKNINEIITEQGEFITNTIKEFKNQIKNVLICGHEPLITYKIKKEFDKSTYISVIDIIFGEKQKYNNIHFTYLCADYHIYQYSKITMGDIFIDQIIVGTGGGQLDNLTPKECDREFVIKKYTLTIYNIHNDNHGIKQFGYVDLCYDNDELTHRFIPIPESTNGSSTNVDYSKKYLKYKNKYVKLKKYYIE